MTHQQAFNSTTPGDVRASLAKALTFHASFDHGSDADFALGDNRIYSLGANGEPALGLGNPPLNLVEGRGKFGAALEFTAENSHVVLYQAAQNVAYSAEEFGGAASFWLSLDPAEIPGQYCDPVQVTDKSFDDNCIWIDFTKNDTPSDFRLGVFGNRSGWDVNNQSAQSREFYWRLAKVVEPPFAKGQWTHVVITWEGLNNTQSGRARLYFNASYQGATGVIRERFSWDIANTRIRLGTGHYVGLFDDIAFFNRALTPPEIRVLYELERGVAELLP